MESSVTGIGAAIAPTPPSATELAPHFPQLEILEVLGRGGMGVVYKVRQKELDRIAALKILPPGIGGEPAFAERFAREAKALARLNHPGIVTIYDSGRADGLFYFLMEFMDGVSLARLMHGGRVSPREALAIVPQICDALQYAHDQGIVHRDIKPENILLDRQGRVKVADFGLAKLLGTGSGSAGSPPPAVGPQTDDGAHGVTRPTNALTEAGKVMGTPAYMAPEQVEHPAEVDHRADIYALGVVFYQMLTGELPGQRLDPPSKKVQIDVRLDEVVLRALEKEPERRYQQVSQVKTAVETILQTAASAALKGEAGREGRATPSNARTGSRAGGWLQYAYAGVAVGLVVLLAIWLGWRPSFRENTSFVDTPTNQLPASPQTVDEVLARYTQARGGLAAAEGTTNLIVEGTWESRDGMGTLQIKALLKAPDKWMLVLQDENGPVWQRAFDGAAGWEVSKWGGAGAANPATLLTGRILMGLYRGEQLAPLLPNMSLKGKDTIRSREVSVLDVALPQGLPARLWFETQTGLLVRIEYGILGSQLQLDLDDYRDIGGLMVPFTMRQTGSENWTVRCRAVKRNEPIEDGRFKRPASE